MPRTAVASMASSRSGAPRAPHEGQYGAPHPSPRNSYGDTYGAHREFLELTVDQHRELKEHCDKISLGYSCSVWDLTSAKEIVSLNPDLIKVGSPSNQHWEMQKVLRDEYSGDVHISTGMTTKDEIEKIVTFWEEGKGDAKNRLVLYNCTSGYPVPFEDVCLLEMRTLYETYVHRVKHLGFSGHHLGIAVDVAAYAMGPPGMSVTSPRSHVEGYGPRCFARAGWHAEAVPRPRGGGSACATSLPRFSRLIRAACEAQVGLLQRGEGCQVGCHDASPRVSWTAFSHCQSAWLNGSFMGGLKWMDGAVRE